MSDTITVSDRDWHTFLAECGAEHVWVHSADCPGGPGAVDPMSFVEDNRCVVCGAVPVPISKYLKENAQ